MGQKASPKSVRLQLNKNWSSKWFSDKKFSDLLIEDLLIKKIIYKKLGRTSGINKIEISRSVQEIKIIIETSKPGIIIGRNGQGISDLKKILSKSLQLHREKINKIKSWKIKNFQPQKITLDKIEIEIIEIREPETYANLVALNIAQQLEKRIAYRRAIKQTISRIIQNRKVLGVKILVSGRLDGIEIARREKFIKGSIPLSRFKANIDFARENAYTSYGVVGIKVWIHKKNEDEKMPNQSYMIE